MTATSTCSKASRSQAEKSNNCGHHMKTTTGASRRAGNKKALHALIFFLHITCKAQEKSCVHLDLNAQKSKNYKCHKISSRNGKVLS